MFYLSFLFFLLLKATTQLARKVQQERTQVVCSNKVGRSRLAQRHSRNGPRTYEYWFDYTFAYSFKQTCAYANIQTNDNRTKHTWARADVVWLLINVMFDSEIALFVLRMWSVLLWIICFVMSRFICSDDHLVQTCLY